ncbi:MAG: NAD-dependent epimerase/dehydratase family protein [Pseudomonadota bacterium]|nr:NAD-dependent epimerase/dehydratase family protein [Pseudomonadota bacterium]
MQRVFVTGVAGLIGRRLAEKLVDSGFAVTGFDLGEQVGLARDRLETISAKGDFTVTEGTILDRTGVARAMRGCSVVVHLAAMLGVKRTEDDRLRCLEINITGSDYILNSAMLNGIDHVIVASSSEVYGEPISNPVKETDITQGKTVYAISKLASEELVIGYAQAFPSLSYTIVRFFNTYGEGQVAQFVLTKFVREVLEGRNPVVYGDGTQVRSYAHVDDITEGLIDIIRNPKARNKVYNLGNGADAMTLKDLAQRVIDLLRPDDGLEVEVLGSFQGSDRLAEREIHHRVCDSTKAFEELGFKATVTLDEGIKRIAAQTEIQHNWPNAETLRS